MPPTFVLRANSPDFLDLPWEFPLDEWSQRCPRYEELPRGVSRHPVTFVNYSGVIYALKEMEPGLAEQEYNLLQQMEQLRLPAVLPVGHARTETSFGERSVLITSFLNLSLPYRSLFIRRSLARYRDHLLDAMAGLLVQLHLAGFFWGDCSLSNTLFRRDAGALQAYLVDAETAEVNAGHTPPTLRLLDLQIMEENVDGDLAALGEKKLLMDGIPLDDTSASIRIRYQNLWEEINRREIVNPEEKYKIQERIQALNSLGFSIGEILLERVDLGDKFDFHFMVTDRNFHHDQLLGLTGIEAQEMQARTMMNEIQEHKATLSQTHQQSVPLSVAAHSWAENLYLPIIERLADVIDRNSDPAEHYCQVLEHKWYLSEKAGRDVGHQAALEDYLASISPKE
jgi:hypothetical protein